jgi:hypothetical protein
MKNTWKRFVRTSLAGALLLLPIAVSGQPPAAAKKSAAKKADVTPAPSAQEIADAKAKGLVWVNLGTGVYHKDGEFFGKTKRGKFLTEAEATKAGYRAAKPSPIGKKAEAKPKSETKK